VSLNLVRCKLRGSSKPSLTTPPSTTHEPRPTNYEQNLTYLASTIMADADEAAKAEKLAAAKKRVCVISCDSGEVRGGANSRARSSNI